MMDVPHNLAPTAQAIIVTGAVATALFMIGRFVRTTIHGTYRFARRLDLIHTTILEELLPNGGSSIKDQISRIDRRVGDLEARVSTLIDEQ